MFMVLEFEARPDNVIGMGFHHEWLSGSRELDGRKIEFAIESGCGLGSPALSFWVEIDGERTYYDADVRTIVEPLLDAALAIHDDREPPDASFPSFSASAGDIRVIAAIVDRAGRECENVGVTLNHGQAIARLIVCHANACPLNLDGLLESNPADLLHDVGGVFRHLDMRTGKLKDAFLPRFALPDAVEDGSTESDGVEDAVGD